MLLSMTAMERPPLAREVPRDAKETLAKRQQRAAETAATVGDFSRNWKNEVRDLLADPASAGTNGARSLEDWRTEADKRTAEIARAAKGNEALRLGDLDPETGGQNTIGGGRSGILLNRSLTARLGTTHTAEELRIAAAHEAAHGRSVQLLGTLRGENGKEVKSLLLHEGYAEVVSMDAEGGGMEQLRAGQPTEVYGEGQRLVLAIIRKVGRDAVEQTLTVDGDVSRLQPAFSQE